MSLLALIASPALACGGFFCNNDAPVDQSAEQIVFAVDPVADTTTVHVQISYAGTDAHDFAWIVPVATQPVLSLSTDRLFQELKWRYQPRFDLRWEDEGDCRYGGRGWGGDAEVALDAAASYSDTSASGYGNGVVVVEERTVGPYETVILRANDTAALLDWLQTNQYDLPDTLEPVLAPYVSEGGYFVALRLSSDRDVGDLAPLAMTYAGQRPSIPIQLTSVAATPDMRLEAYVLGPHRAVPDNYLHVKINPVAIDWERAGANYENVITLAADEAGGHAFATDFSGPTDAMRNALYSEGRFDLDRLAASGDAITFMNELINQGFPADATLLGILQDVIPFPSELAAQGVQPTDFYNCLSCYAEYLDANFDAAYATAEIETFIVEPLREAQATIDAHPTISRLTSSISPVEMTIDPMFVFNPDMGEVDGLYRSNLVTMCGDGNDWEESPMRLELPNGMVIKLPSREWLDDNDMTIAEFIADLTGINALIIEETGASGAPSVLQDHSASVDAAIRENNARVDAIMDALRKGCGCATPGSAPAGAWGLLATLGLVLRRRR